MALIPKNENPLVDYVDGSVNTAMTVDGLVVNKVYGVTGVIDTLPQQKNAYQDPASNQNSNLSAVNLANPPAATVWYSGVVDDAVDTTYNLQFQFNRTTYINFVSFRILQVPCSWTLYQQSSSGSLTKLYSGVVIENNGQYFQYQEILLNQTYTFDSTTSLLLQIVKVPNGQQYSFGIYDFKVLLNAINYSDLDPQGTATTISGLTTQNALGIVETYWPIKYALTNMQNAPQPVGEVYWKCAPQPVGDSVVYFVIDLNQYSIPKNLFSTTDSYLTSVGGWTRRAAVNISSSIVTSGVNNGFNNSLLVTATANNSTWFANTDTVSAVSGQVFSGTFSVYPINTALSGVYLDLIAQDGSGTFIQDIFDGNQKVNCPANQWTTITTTGLVMPTNTAQFQFSPRVSSSVSGQQYLFNAPGVVNGISTNLFNSIPTTVDSIYIDPLYSGTVYNLYSSLDNVNWAPVQKDFRLKKGVFQIPSTLARYFKFEFTQLTAEPYDLPFDSIQRTIEVFPDSVDSYYTNIENAIPNIANQSYALSSYNPSTQTFNKKINSASIYGLAIQNLSSVYGSTGNGAPGSSISPTITDPTISYKTIQDVAGIGSTYNPLTDVNFLIRRFPYYGPHTYKQVNINQTWHQSYFTGIKTLFLYSTNQSVQMDYTQFNDNFTVSPGSSNTIINSTTTATFRSPVIASGSSSVIISGTGYTGKAGSQIITNNLKTYSQFNNFKFASLNTDWQPFLTQNQTLLNSSSLSSLGVTVSGATVNSIPTNSNYGLWQITPNSTAPTYVQSAQAGGSNLMTTAEAYMVSGTGWSGPINSSSAVTTGTISGTTSISLNSAVYSYMASYGEEDYGNVSFGASTLLGGSANAYSFLMTASGNGSATFYVVYSGAGGTTVTSGSVTLTGASGLNFLSSQPVSTNVASFAVSVTAGTLTFSNAGFFSGIQNSWVSPLVTSGMRISAVARIYLPSTNNGTYRCSLYSGNTEIAHAQFSNIPLQTWVDIEIPFCLSNSTLYNYGNFSARLSQNNGSGEAYQLAMLGIFYNPVTWQYSTDNGSNWNWITVGVNDPFTSINTRSTTNQIQLKATFVQDNVFLSSMELVPGYVQTPYYNTTPINYLSDAKINELDWQLTPEQRPLFQLPNFYYPTAYSISSLMNINTPYILA